MDDRCLDAHRRGLADHRFLDTRRRGRRRRSRRTLEVERLRFAWRLEARWRRRFARLRVHRLGSARPGRFATNLFDRGAVVPATSRRLWSSSGRGGNPAFAALTDAELGFRALGDFALTPALARLCGGGSGTSGSAARREAFATAATATTTTTATRTAPGALGAITFCTLLLPFTDECRRLEHGIA